MYTENPPFRTIALLQPRSAPGLYSKTRTTPSTHGERQPCIPRTPLVRSLRPTRRGTNLWAAPICGEKIVFYRPAPDQVAALDDFCLTRARMSLGSVCEGHLQCGYHGLRVEMHRQVGVHARSARPRVPQGEELSGGGALWLHLGVAWRRRQGRPLPPSTTRPKPTNLNGPYGGGCTTCLRPPPDDRQPDGPDARDLCTPPASARKKSTTVPQ